MKKAFKILLIIIVTMLLIILFTPIFARLYGSINPIQGGIFIGSSKSWNLIFGSFLSYIFTLSLIFTILKVKNKYLYLFILFIPIILFDIYGFFILDLFIHILMFIIGCLLGEAILHSYKYFSKNKK